MDRINNYERSAWIDNAKIIGLYLMIVGHLSLLPPTPTQIIYSFHMPLFFFLSGILYKRTTCFKEQVIKSFHRLIIPYIFINGILLMMDFILNSLIFSNQWVIIPRIKAIILGMGYGLDGLKPVCAPSWFLVSLFIIQLITYWLDNKKIAFLACVFVIAVNILIQQSDLHVISPVSIVMGLPFFCIGFFVKDKIVENKFQPNFLSELKYVGFIALLSVLIACTVILSMINGRVECSKVYYGSNIMLFYVNALLGISCVVLFSKIIGSVLNTFVIVICRGTLFVLGFHIFFIQLYVHRYLSYFYVFAIVNSAVVTTGVHFEILI